jgi:hypothetical protein
MEYQTLSEPEQARIAFEVIQTLPVDQFEAALEDDSFTLEEPALTTYLNQLESEHLRASVRASVSSDFPAPPGSAPAANPAALDELEKRIAAIKKRLKSKK